MALCQHFFFDFGTDDFPFNVPFQHCSKIVVFPLWRREPVLELQIAAICGAVVGSSIAFCNSVSADRSGMAASRFLVAAAECAVLLRFAVESRKSSGGACSCAAHVHGGMFKSLLRVKASPWKSFSA